MVKHLCASTVLLASLALLALSAIPVAPGVVDVKSPAGSGSAEPNLTTGSDGRVFMTWLEPGQQGKGSILYFSTLQSQAWSAPKVIARGSNWFVNAADFPSLSCDARRRAGFALAGHDGRRMLKPMTSIFHFRKMVEPPGRNPSPLIETARNGNTALSRWRRRPTESSAPYGSTDGTWPTKIMGIWP